eukprot:CAMPEP_0170464358 /NCGR_PEP_ID=MMETSP0123-20130129/9122_1 /TAXON_ID=182087 /ORGANISM="Favella ehrenbergii, Strain Fehren 1" /LENGTH=245 /DNA_ID=CAMNT_0010730015 /DNA_START=858 /DNA_END=1595 /DNA_ORIENTATION=-
MNDEDSSDASGSDTEIVPLEFRTAMINNGTKLVIQAKPKEYSTVEQEMQAVEQGRFEGAETEHLDPDKTAGDLEAYLKSLRKEAFDADDENVVLIDPGQTSLARYEDILLPCEKEQRANNSLAAPKGSSPEKQSASINDASDHKKKAQRMLKQSLRQAEKQSALQQPDYYDKRIKAEREAYIRAQMFKGPVFYTPPEKDSDEEENAAIEANPNLNFNDILSGMGGSGFLSNDSEEEEEKKEAPYG